MQSEQTRIHLLHEKVSGTLKCILECYIKRDYLEATPLSDVQYKDPAKFLPLEEIYLGAKPTAALSGGTHGLNDDQIHNFRLRCLEFFIEAARQIYLRFPLKSPQLKNLRVLDPKVVIGKTISSIAPLAVSFPLIVRENEVNELDREWRLLRNMDLSEHAGFTASQFWHARCGRTCVFATKSAENKAKKQVVNRRVVRLAARKKNLDGQLLLHVPDHSIAFEADEERNVWKWTCSLDSGLTGCALMISDDSAALADWVGPTPPPAAGPLRRRQLSSGRLD
ncbi:hypothetical protein HPB51_025709 [Rhipicephalus microplus]|uniref:Uncharacterized protein n=1 Tax=Rhipicephalus microplus TaxID=6941 RepID=A0A9J6EQP5_RHIMP|nr:hypothetical protein HPB51_025709 [Rhipicephalus microplus]